MMKVIYIAGPYRSQDEWRVRMNIRKAEEAALAVWQNGAVALCPHKNSAGMGGAPGTFDDMWLEGDLELLKRCDAVWLIENWEYSRGASREMIFAKAHDIPVLFSRQDMIDFVIGGED
jgi:nucleoside 2-deoxyribosyltransferase